MPEIPKSKRKAPWPLRALGWLVAFALVAAVAAGSAWGVARWMVQPIAIVTVELEGDPVAAALEWNDGAHGRWVRLSSGAALRETLPVYPIDHVTLRMADAGDASIGEHVRAAKVALEYRINGHLLHEAEYPSRGAADVSDGKMLLMDGVPPLPAEKQWALGQSIAIPVAIILAVPLLIVLLWPVLSNTGGGFVIALLAAIGIRAWLLWWSPVLLSPDSMRYALNAERILNNQPLGGDDWYRVPGYSVFLAPFVAWTQNFALSAGIAQAVLGVLTAIFVFVLLRQYVRGPLPALAMIIVACDPVLLTYERYLLTECVSTFLMTAITVCTVLLARKTRVGGWTWVWVILLGLACGAAVYVRSNLQILAVLVLVFITIGLMRRGRVVTAIGHGVVFAVVCAAVVLPWCYRQLALHGEFSVAIGTKYTRSMSSWNLGLVDLDQTALVPADKWFELEPKIVAGGVSDYEGIGAVLKANPREALADEERGIAPPPYPVHVENICDAVVRESIVRRPLDYLRGVAVAAMNLIGLAPYANHATALENVLWSEPLRGKFDWRQTNVTQAAFIVDNPEMQPLIERATVDTGYLADRLNDMIGFNVLFWVYYHTRPIIAVFFLLGVAWALFSRCWGMFAAGLVAVANAAGLALIVFSSIDRYGAPIKPLLIALAAFAAYRLARALAPYAPDDECSPRDSAKPFNKPAEQKDIYARLEPRTPPPASATPPPHAPPPGDAAI